VDEALCLRLLGDLMVVVDHDPGLVGPVGQVFGQDLGENTDVLSRRREGAKVRDARSG